MAAKQQKIDDATFPAESWFRNAFIAWGLKRCCKCCLLDWCDKNPGYKLTNPPAAAVAVRANRRGDDDEVVIDGDDDYDENAAELDCVAVAGLGDDASGMTRHLRRKHNIADATSAPFTGLLERWGKSQLKIQLRAVQAQIDGGRAVQQHPRLNAASFSGVSKLLSITKLSNEQLMLHLMASTRDSFRITENPFYGEVQRRLSNSAPLHGTVKLERHSVAGKIAALADATESALLALDKQMIVGSLAVDSGTVVKRYVVVVAHFVGVPQPVVVGAAEDSLIGVLQVNDADAADAAANVGRHTIPNLTAFLGTAISNFERKYPRVYFASVVTDNAANVVGMAESVGRWPVRCACHGLQLMVSHVEGLHKTTYDTVKLWYTNSGLKDHEGFNVRAPQDPKWGTRFQFLESVTALLTANGEPGGKKFPDGTPRCAVRVATLNATLADLSPFLAATRHCERDASDTISIIEAVAMILPVLNAVNDGVAEAIKEEIVKNLISPPLIIVCILLPTFNVADDAVVRIKALVQQWLLRPAAVAWTTRMRTTPDVLLREWQSYWSTPKATGGLFDRVAFEQHLKWMRDTNLRVLASFLKHVSTLR